ncbi:MAG: succinate dehydrogenase, cytochrome b556 subunit, partial [Alphaproteobacteria bacterium]|nr:succinate dehydrogenase, cytochrome b556 subunit [Alphaproteobacteria bacterium]
GIRHLFWDLGKGFELKETYASGYAVILLSLILTALFYGEILWRS